MADDRDIRDLPTAGNTVWDQDRTVGDPTAGMPGVSDFATGETSGQGGMPTSFENYEILEELPRGGQAAVYKARHIPTQTTVAIKVLLPTLLSSARARYYFKREAELIAQLDHPGIVKIRDSGIVQGQYFFVMEFVQGQPLHRHVRLNKLSQKQRLELFCKITSAITHAHQKGIIHRDLKFGNIMVDEHGEPHILDFGLAKAMDLSDTEDKGEMATVTGQWSGSLSNMSPEQAAGKPDEIDTRSDVYSLGVILYHLLTGEYPYDISGATLEVLQTIQSSEPRRPRAVNPKLESDLEAIVMTAIAKKREDRYQTTAEFEKDIKNYLEGRPVSVKAIDTWYVVRKILARHKLATTVAGALVVIVMSFAYVSFTLYLDARRAKEEAQYVAEQHAAEAARNLQVSRKLAFNMFLDAWQNGDRGRATMVANVLSAGTKERIAARFLLDTRPVAEKTSALRSMLGEDSSWFANLMIGEGYLQEGNREAAAAAFAKGMALVSDAGSREDIDERLVDMLRVRNEELNETQEGQ